MNAPHPIPLEELAAGARRGAAERRRRQPLGRLRRIVREDPWRRERLLAALAEGADHGAGLALVAPCVRRVPRESDRETRRTIPAAAEELRRTEAHDFFERAAEYARAGAAALAVVTEGERFGGRMEDLRTVEHAGLPRVRVDLVLDEGMVLESGVYGADGLTLWPRLLLDGPLAALRAVAREAGFAVCMVVHDERELERALVLEPELVVVRGRDPLTLEPAPEALARLLALLQRDAPRAVAAASGGLAGPEDLDRARHEGARVAFLGAALARSPHPGATLAAWRAGLAG